MRSWDTLFELRRVPTYEVHGVWMFAAWVPLGYVLLATKRYLKGNWKLWNFIHIFVGVVTLAITIWQTLEISLRYGWGWTDDVHSILGTIAIAATIIATLTGGLAAAYMKFYDGDKEWAPTERATTIGKIHKWVSYFILFFANVIVLGGTITYCLTYVQESKYIPLGIISFLFFINIVLVSEYLHRKKARSENSAKQFVAECSESALKGKKNGNVREYTAQ